MEKREIVCTSGKKYVLEKLVATGGEGEIYYLNKGLIAKIYLKKVLVSNPEIEEKISFMVKNPPESEAAQYMAWPTDIVIGDDGKFGGFIMNNLNGFLELRSLYSYSIKKNPDVINNIRVAINLSNLVRDIHNAKYIIGDFNPKNIGHSYDGAVCIYDNDSFQFVDPETNHVFKCNVQFDGYVAPEIMIETNNIKRKMILEGKDPNSMSIKDLEIGFTYETDRFALAVHIFQLLMNGFNPYSSIPRTDSRGNDLTEIANRSSSTMAPSANENVMFNRYCFNPDRQPYNKAVPSKEQFPPYLIDLFNRAFNYTKDSKRPTAEEWIAVLNKYLSESKRCPKVDKHIYWNKISSCPYCDANVRFANITKITRDTRGPRYFEPVNRPKPEFDKHWIN